jgi:hypothetical protein
VLFILRNESLLIDSLLPLYSEMIFENYQKSFANDLDLPSISTYIQRFFVPFFLLFGGSIDYYRDTPLFMAELIMGYSDINHFPSTIFAESFLLYSWFGTIIFSSLFIFSTFSIRYLMYCYKIEFILLPFYLWHAYNFIRGTFIIATVPFTYAIYFVIIAMFLSKVFMFKSSRK